MEPQVLIQRLYPAILHLRPLHLSHNTMATIISERAEYKVTGESQHQLPDSLSPHLDVQILRQ